MGLQILQHLVANGQRGGDTLYLLKIDFAIALGYELGCGIPDTVDIDGEDAHGTSGDRQLRQLNATSLQLHVMLGREMLQALVVVDEDKTTAILRANAPTQMRIVALADILRTREHGLHRCQHITPILHKQMQFAQHIVMRILLTKLTQGCLKIVGLHRHIVIVGSHGALHFVESSQLTIGVGATMIHVIAQQI